MSIVRNADGTYRFGRMDGLFRMHVRRLDGAWVPLPSGASAADDAQAPRTFGWVMGGLPAPSVGDRYIVEYVGEKAFRVLAYMDRFGRVFTESEAIEAPPAREPDMAFARFAESRTPGLDEDGYVQVRMPGAPMRPVARYGKKNGRYHLYDTWYRFGEYGVDADYADTLARCYVAFVVRPSEGAMAVPSCDFATVRDALRDKAPLRALDAIEKEISQAKGDTALRPPALLACLGAWLQEAGLSRIRSAVRLAAGEKAEPLRLVRTKRYADTYYLGRETEEDAASSAIADRDIWALEAALNRFLLAGEQLGGEAVAADEAQCFAVEANLFASVGHQVLDANDLIDSGEDPSGEWDLRVHIGRAMERLRLPVRYFAKFKADVDSGVVAFDVTVPDAELMPRNRWDAESSSWVPFDEAARSRCALHYAQRLGVLLAAMAFSGSRLVTAVLIRALPLESEPAVSLEDSKTSVLKSTTAAEPAYRVLFDRDAFCADDAYRRALEGDPGDLFADCGALYGWQAQGDPFDVIDNMGSAAFRREAPESVSVRLNEEVGAALGARVTRDLRISYEGALRHAGEMVADYVVGAASATQAIKLVRAKQEDSDDPRVVEACTRLMKALVEGTVDATDQNALVACFVGEDRYQLAFNQARSVVMQDPMASVSILRTAIMEAEQSGLFADNAETVHRVFESYATRVTYNLVRPEGDEGKYVELVPASLLLCYLDAMKLLEDSFEHAEEALALGLRCMEMAPTLSIAFRQTARAHMLMGDLESSSNILRRCLEFALQEEEIAVAYYQLAYVEWKMGRPLTGAACYLKSIMTSSVYAPQATIELQELVSEEGVDMLPREKVDTVLEEGGIPVAPNVDLLEKVDRAVKAAVDANLFSVARSLLSTRLRHRPDDALANVLRSL